MTTTGEKLRNDNAYKAGACKVQKNKAVREEKKRKENSAPKLALVPLITTGATP